MFHSTRVFCRNKLLVTEYLHLNNAIIAKKIPSEATILRTLVAINLIQTNGWKLKVPRLLKIFNNYVTFSLHRLGVLHNVERSGAASTIN